jgi:diamine N-acetyltransferase
MRTLSLRPVDAHNVDAVCALAPHEAQQRFIASNAESLELAARHAHMHARAIYAGEVLVGFALYAEAGPAGRQDTHVLYRLMIAAGEQGRRPRPPRAGAAARRDARAGRGRVALYYAPDNLVARQLYASAGFAEAAIDADGEMMAVRAPA